MELMRLLGNRLYFYSNAFSLVQNRYDRVAGLYYDQGPLMSISTEGPLDARVEFRMKKDGDEFTGSSFYYASLDGKRILQQGLALVDGAYSGGIFLQENGEVKLLLEEPPGFYYSITSFSSDGSTLVYQKNGDGTHESFEYNLDTQISRQIPNPPFPAPPGPDITGGNGPSLAVSGDRKFVYFSTTKALTSDDVDQDGEDIYKRSLVDGSLQLVTGYLDPQLSLDQFSVLTSDDGRWCLYQYRSRSFKEVRTETPGIVLVEQVFTGPNQFHLVLKDTQSNQAFEIVKEDIPSVMYPKISADGSKVYFFSPSNLNGPDDTNEGDDIFVFTKSDGVLRNLTSPTKQTPALAAGPSLQPAINYDGSKVAFASLCSTIAPVRQRPWQETTSSLPVIDPLAFRYRECYTYLWSKGEPTRAIHTSADGLGIGSLVHTSQGCPLPFLDDSGQLCVYSSNTYKPEGKLLALFNGTLSLFIRDFGKLLPEELGLKTDFGLFGEEEGKLVTISGDGKTVGYSDPNQGVVLKNLLDGSQSLIANFGQSVRFSQDASKAVYIDGVFDGPLKLWDRGSGQSNSLAVGDDPKLLYSSPVISNDGKWIAARGVTKDSRDDLLSDDIYLYDVKNMKSINVTGLLRGTKSGVNETDTLLYDSLSEKVGNWRFIDLSDDGRYLAFSSYYNLDPNDQNIHPDIYVYDRVRCACTLVSRDISGKSPNGKSLFCGISGDGRWIVFDSDASNLVSGDNNLVADVFRVKNPLFVEP